MEYVYVYIYIYIYICIHWNIYIIIITLLYILQWDKHITNNKPIEVSMMRYRLPFLLVAFFQDERHGPDHIKNTSADLLGILWIIDTIWIIDIIMIIWISYRYHMDHNDYWYLMDNWYHDTIWYLSEYLWIIIIDNWWFYIGDNLIRSQLPQVFPFQSLESNQPCNREASNNRSDRHIISKGWRQQTVQHSVRRFEAPLEKGKLRQSSSVCFIRT